MKNFVSHPPQERTIFKTGQACAKVRAEIVGNAIAVGFGKTLDQWLLEKLLDSSRSPRFGFFPAQSDLGRHDGEDGLNVKE